MSPLFPVYHAAVQQDQRAKVVSTLLDAHSLLAYEIDGIDTAQVERTLSHRASSLLQLSRDLRDLATRPSPPTCQQRDHMLAFYTLLDRQLEAGSQPTPGAEGGVPPALALGLGPGQDVHSEGAQEAQLYHDVASGTVSVWEAWATHFEQRYSNAPSLEPLEVIYSMQQRADQQQQQLPGSPSQPAGQPEAAESKKGVRMDVSGTVLAEGKRKGSKAKVLLREGGGLITVNGLPYDAYFQELHHRMHMLQPLMLLPKYVSAWDIQVEVEGTGRSSQAQAVRTAIARALRLVPGRLNTAARRLLPVMARWDGRRVERKKPGRVKARKAFTYVRR